MCNENSSQLGTILAAFAVGAIAGAGLALLYAPQSGKETRDLLAKRARDLKDKVGETTGGTGISPAPRDPQQADAVAALVSLGYKQADAQKAVAAASETAGSEVTVEELVRAALRG